MEVRRCDSNSSQIPFLSALPPSLARRRWLIFRSLAVQLSLTRPPPRSAPPPPTPRVLCPASRARFALPQSNRAPAAPAPRRVSPCARVVRPWRLKPPQDPAFEPWSPAAAAHPGVELRVLALLQIIRTFAHCRHRVGRRRLPPIPPSPWCSRRALAKIELRRPVELSTARPLPVQRQSEPLPLVQEPFEPARARAGHRVRQNAWAPHGAHAHRLLPWAQGPGAGEGGWEGSGWARGLATRGADPVARARWRVMRSARVASRATAGACGLCGRISAHVARARSALIIVARECHLIVANAILIYKKGTERSKTVPNTLITMFADLAPRAAFGATGCGRPDVATFDAHDGYGASISTGTTTAGKDAVPRLVIRTSHACATLVSLDMDADGVTRAKFSHSVPPRRILG